MSKIMFVHMTRAAHGMVYELLQSLYRGGAVVEFRGNFSTTYRLSNTLHDPVRVPHSEPIFLLIWGIGR